MEMVLLTRKQLEKLSMKKLRDKLLTVNSIHKKLANLTSSFDDLSKKYARVEYELEVSKNYTKLVSRQIRDGNITKKRIGLFELPEDIQDKQLEKSICQALSFTVTLVLPSDLEACHRMR